MKAALQLIFSHDNFSAEPNTDQKTKKQKPKPTTQLDSIHQSLPSCKNTSSKHFCSVSEVMIHSMQ